MDISSARPLRIGLLGVARITLPAVVDPARGSSQVKIAAVAARDPGRARAFAAEHGIERVAADYEALVRDPDLDAVYIPLPNSLHAPWTLSALACGKHVLCEKPLACNAAEARLLVDAAKAADLLLMEAFHYAYHPLTHRWRQLLARGAIGKLTRLGATFLAATPDGDIRYDFSLAGGAMMDLGCYCVHLLRSATGEEPTVVRAAAVESPPNLDSELVAELRFPSGAVAEVRCGMRLAEGFQARLRIEGTGGVIEVDGPMLPHLGNRLRVTSADLTLDEEVTGRTSYAYQLDAFVEALRTGVAPPTSGEDAVANLRVIDAAYAAAGLPLRG